MFSFSRLRLICVCVLLEGTRLNDRSETAEEEKWGRKRTALGTDSSTPVSFTDTSWDHMAKAMPWPAQRSEVGGSGVTEVFLPGGHYEKRNEVQQVHACSLCLARGYLEAPAASQDLPDGCGFKRLLELKPMTDPCLCNALLLLFTSCDSSRLCV